MWLYLGSASETISVVRCGCILGMTPGGRRINLFPEYFQLAPLLKRCACARPGRNVILASISLPATLLLDLNSNFNRGEWLWLRRSPEDFPTLTPDLLSFFPVLHNWLLLPQRASHWVQARADHREPPVRLPVKKPCTRLTFKGILCNFYSKNKSIHIHIYFALPPVYQTL